MALVAQMFGPVEGRRHDATLLKLSNIDQKMHLLPAGSFVYGDQAYQVRPWLLSPFRGPNKPHHTCEGGIGQCGLSESQLNMGLKS